MSTAESIFASIGVEEPHIIIGSDRVINVPEELRRIAVQFDHNIETVTFDCPRYWDEHDMSTMTVYVNYMRADGVTGSYKADNVRVDDTDNTIMHFDWTITRNTSEINGKLAVLVCVRSIDDDGNEQNHWNSELNRDMYISEGMDCCDVIANLHPDVITQILTKIDTIENKLTEALADLEKGTIKELDIVDLSTCESGVYLTNTIRYNKAIIPQPFTEMMPGKALLIVEKTVVGTSFEWLSSTYILAGLSNAEGNFENEFVKYEFSKFATKDYVSQAIGDIEKGTIKVFTEQVNLWELETGIYYLNGGFKYTSTSGVGGAEHIVIIYRPQVSKKAVRYIHFCGGSSSGSWNSIDCGYTNGTTNEQYDILDTSKIASFINDTTLGSLIPDVEGTRGYVKEIKTQLQTNLDNKADKSDLETLKNELQGDIEDISALVGGAE